MSAVANSGCGAEEAAVKAVVFRLGPETFALPVDMVREILDYREAFHMPGAPAWLLGLTDVRGESVLMVDLRLRLGLAATEPTLTTRILVADIVSVTGKQVVLGLVVDRVLDVRDFASAAIENVPTINASWDPRYIKSVMRSDDGFVILLNGGEVISGEDSLALDAAA